MDNMRAAAASGASPQDSEGIGQALPPMPRREEVQDKVCELWEPAPLVERVAVDAALGRVLAQAVQASFSSPAGQVAAMDGIGVHFDDFAAGLPDTAVWVRGKDYAVCDTGDDVPDEFDTVIPVEDLDFHDGSGRSFPGEQGNAPFDRGFSVVKAPQERGANVRAAGSSFSPGDEVIPTGARLTPQRLSAAVACGAQALQVYARPRVAVIPTGDELVEPGAVPERGKTLNSNAVLLSSYIRLLGGEPLVFPIVADRRPLIEEALDRALSSCDIVLVNAGSSKGSEDCGPHALASRAVTVVHHGQKAAPGRPSMAAVMPANKVACVIPGPPLSCDTAMLWLVKTLVARWYGLSPRESLVRARVDCDVPAGDFEVWRRCELACGEDGTLRAHVLPKRSSGIFALGRAEAVLRTPTESDLHAGDVVELLLLGDGVCL